MYVRTNTKPTVPARRNTGNYLVRFTRCGRAGSRRFTTLDKALGFKRSLRLGDQAVISMAAQVPKP